MKYHALVFLKKLHIEIDEKNKIFIIITINFFFSFFMVFTSNKTSKHHRRLIYKPF